MIARVVVQCGLVALWLGAAPLQASNKPPVIDHAPVKVAVKGQNVVIRATITDDAGPVREATLFVAVSRDAAPFRITMTRSGDSLYTGTISAGVLNNLDQVQYYIDAVDSNALTTETPWYTLAIKSPEPGKSVAAEGSAAPEQAKRPSWVKPALIAGGVLAAGGVALALSGGGGGGGGDNSTGTNKTSSSAGTYTGSATTCFQPPSASSTCASGAITITIDANGHVVSDSLYSGQSLSGSLSGSSFVLTATVQTGDRSGQIDYIGTVVDTRIVGSIQGTATTAGGSGTYSGTFTAVKR